MKDIQLIIDKNHISYMRSSPYTCRNRFSFAYEPVKEGKVKLDEWMEPCREVMCDRIREQFRVEKKFDIKKTRIVTNTKLIAHNDNIKLNEKQKDYIEKLKIEYVREMLTSIKIVNLIEKEFKWPLTKIYPAKCKGIDYHNNIFHYFEGSRKWVKSPNMFSLFMLLIRVSSSLKKYIEFRTLDGFYKCLGKNKLTVDINYLKTHYKRSLLAIEHYNVLFGKPSMRELYIPNRNLVQFPEGLNTMCDLDTNNLDLRVKFAKILDEKKMLRIWEKCKLIKEKE